jgi:hypothetical protein
LREVARELFEDVSRALRRRLRRVVQAVAQAGEPPAPPLFVTEPVDGEAYAWISRRRAYLYVSRSEKRSAIAQIELRAARRYVASAPTAAFLIASAMTFFSLAVLPVAPDHAPATVTALLLVPALLGYLVVRPGEHPLARRHLAGVRFLVFVSGSLPVAAAISLLAGEWPTGCGVEISWWAQTALAWLCFVLLSISWLLPSPAQGEQG